MRPATLHRAATAALLFALGACGSSDSTDPGNGGNPGGGTGQFHMTARIDGTAWASSAGSETVGVSLTLPGLYVLYGAQVGSASPYIIAISLYNIGGPGTYPLGVGPQVPGGSVVLSNATGGWATPQSGADGSITITSLTASQIAGTFSFTVNALTGSATGTRTVTQGEFMLPVKATGTVGALPDNAGSKVSATIGGAAWNAAGVAGQLSLANKLLTVASSNSTRGLGISLSGVTGPGTYALGTSGGAARLITITGVASPSTSTWSSLGAGSSGSVTITSVTATRVKGTFSAVLGPAPGFQTTGTLAVANGVFDLGLLTPP